MNTVTVYATREMAPSLVNVRVLFTVKKHGSSDIFLQI